MSELTCCKNSSWVPELDLEHAGGFEFLLGKCGRCGTIWMNVFCVATSMTGYERVSPGDAEAMRSVSNGSELKAFMLQWGDNNL